MNELLKTVFFVDVLKNLDTKNLLRLKEINKGFNNYVKNNLKYLKIDCSSSNITDHQLKALAGVHTIHLYFCKNITDVGLSYLKGVQNIDLTCTEVTDEGLKYLKGVSIIILTFCKNITDKGLSYMEGVHTINLEDCYRITDKGLSYLQGVQNIDLSGSPEIPIVEEPSTILQITDKGLSYLKGVKTINLSFCDSITDEGLFHIKGVQTISLRGCTKITDKGLKYLKGVQNINLDLCTNITKKGLIYLKGVKKISIFHVRDFKEDLSLLNGANRVNTYWNYNNPITMEMNKIKFYCWKTHDSVKKIINS